MHCRLSVRLPRSKDRTRKFWLVNRVRKVLRLEANRVVHGMRVVARILACPVHCVTLDPWLSRLYRHVPAADFVVEFRSHNALVTDAIDHIVMIDSGATEAVR